MRRIHTSAPRRAGGRLLALCLAGLATLFASQTVMFAPRVQGAKQGKLTTMVRMEGLGDCPELPNPPNGFTASEIFPMGKTLYGRGDFTFRHNYTRFTKAVAHIKRCADRNDPHCEPFQNWRFGDESCNLLTMKNMIWTPLFNLNPPLTCPTKAGQYRVDNVTVDLERLKVIHFPEKGFWKISLMVDADNIPKVLCYYFEISFIKVRL